MAANITYGPAATIAARPAPAPKRRKPPQLTTAQRKEMAAKRSAKTAELNAEIADWYHESVTFSQKLAEKYDKKADVCLRLMFFGGSTLHTKRKPNAYNAWSHHLAQEAHDAGSTMKLLDLQKENIQQYHELTDAQRAELIAELEEERTSRSMGLRASQRSRIRDVDNACKIIEGIIHGLKNRAGVEAFFCIVRAKPDFQMVPRWYFSTMAIDTYLRGAVRKGWDPEYIGSLTEAFAVAGCDVMNFLQTSKAKADWYKGLIRDKINSMLVDITGNKKAAMNYVSYEQDIVLRYGIELRGWTHEKFANPSNLSTSLPPLRILLDALESGACVFVRLSAAELKTREQAYDRRVAAGEVPARKQRKDTGGTHAKRGKKRLAEDGDSSDSSEEEVEQPAKRRRKSAKHKSAATVNDSDNDEAEEGATGAGDCTNSGVGTEEGRDTNGVDDRHAVVGPNGTTTNVGISASTVPQ